MTAAAPSRTPVHVEQVDPQLEPILRRWWETGRDCWAGDRAGDEWPAWAAARRALRLDNPELETSLFLAYAGDEVVGFANLALPLLENPHLAFLDVGVLPAHRRRGHGTTIVRDLEQRVRNRGRGTVVAEGYVPLAGSGPCEPFAAALGYDVGNVETVKRLEVGVHRSRRESLRAEVEPGLAGYRMVGWDTECPDEHVEDFCRLLSGFNAQVPLGELALEDSPWTPDRLRTWDAWCRAAGRRSFSAAAVAPDGSLAGVSGIRVEEEAPTHGSVGITLVSPEHRGRRLGLALKTAATDLALTHFPDLVHVTTSNADSNAAMNAVNERLGYQPVERLLELQAVLDGTSRPTG